MHNIANVTFDGRPALQLSGPGVAVVVDEKLIVVSVSVGGRELLAQPAEVAEVADITPGAALIERNRPWTVVDSRFITKATDGHAAVTGVFQLERSRGEGRHDTETRTVTLRIELASGRLRFATRVEARLPVVQRAQVNWSLACRFDGSDQGLFQLLSGVVSSRFSEPPWRLWSDFDQPGGILLDGDRAQQLVLDYGLAGVSLHAPGDGILAIGPQTAAWDLTGGPFAAPLHESSFTLYLVDGLEPDGDDGSRYDRALASSPDAEILGNYGSAYPEHRELVGQLAEHTRSAGVRTAPLPLLAGFAASTGDPDGLRWLASRLLNINNLSAGRAIALGLDPLKVVNEQTLAHMTAWIDQDKDTATERRDALRLLLRHVALAETNVSWLREQNLIDFCHADLREGLPIEQVAARWRLCAEFLSQTVVPEATANAARRLVGAIEGRTRAPWRGALERRVLHRAG